MLPPRGRNWQLIIAKCLEVTNAIIFSLFLMKVEKNDTESRVKLVFGIKKFYFTSSGACTINISQICNLPIL
jgi:hypothetical protein